MKKQTYKRLISLMLIGLMMFSDISPVFATVDEKHTHTHEADHTSDEVEVLYKQDSTFTVTIPKLVTLDSSKTSTYTVTVEGDIASDKTVNVVPEESFEMVDQAQTGVAKENVEATVQQDKTAWTFNEFATLANGNIEAKDLTSGSWKGSFWFNISLEDDNPLKINLGENLNVSSVEVGQNSTIQLSATIDGEEATDLVTWESDSNSILVENGLIETTAKTKAGDVANITATFEMPTVFSRDASANILEASVTVTVVDIIITEVGGTEIITELDIKPGESKVIEGTIIPGSATNKTITWYTTAIGGVNIYPNGNLATVKIASDMETGQSYFVVGTVGNFAKFFKINIVSDHVHNYSSEITKEVTCTENGIEKFTCECGDTYEEEIKSEGHKYADTVINPTCIAEGYTIHDCNNCDYSYRDAYKDALGHTSVNGSEKDIHTKCSVCGITLSSEHTYTFEITKEANCTEDGTKIYTCECGYSYEEALTKLNHTYSDWNTTLNPTCESVGSKQRTCSVCGNVDTADVAVLGHDYSSTFTVDKEATCTVAGSKSKHCSRCSSTTETTTIPATGHTNVNGGTQAIHTKCSVCGATTSTAHSYTNKVTTAATCTATGVRTYTCGCGYSYTETIAKNASNHTGSAVNGGTSGVHTKYSCCGATISTQHSYTVDSGVQYTAATCTAARQNYKKCSCGYNPKSASYIVATGSANGHKSANGGTSGVHTKCSVCGVTLSATHTYSTSVAVAATCTTAGTTKYTCGCGYSYTSQNIAAKGHSSVYGGTSGVHTKCGTCGVTLSTGHSYSSKVAAPSTCTVAGKTKYTCGCGYSYTSQDIPAMGHDYSSYTTVGKMTSSSAWDGGYWIAYTTYASNVDFRIGATCGCATHYLYCYPTNYAGDWYGTATKMSFVGTTGGYLHHYRYYGSISSPGTYYYLIWEECNTQNNFGGFWCSNVYRYKCSRCSTTYDALDPT